MIRTKKNVFLPAVLIFLCYLCSNKSAFADSGAQIHPRLQQVLLDTSPDDRLNIYIKLRDRMSLNGLRQETAFLPRKERQQAVVSLLKSHAAVTQANVMNFLRTATAAGDVSDILNIWSINIIAMKATPGTIYSLAQDFPEIGEIWYDPPLDPAESQDDGGISRRVHENNEFLAPLNNPQQGLLLINAPLVWAEGDSGQGVIVANVDSGTDWDHPDLVNNMWNNIGEDADGDGRTLEFNGSSWTFDPGDVNGVDDDGNGFVDDFIGWNFSFNNNNPDDNEGHGTQTCGLVVGDGTNGTETGVAPRAKIMILNIASAGASGWWAAYQYAVENGVDVITSSYSQKWNSQPDYASFRAINDFELAAGVVHTNSIGNQGSQSTPGCNNSYPIPYNISAPGNSPSPWIHPDQNTVLGGISSVIGCGNVNAFTDVIENGSGFGPATWENVQQRCPNFPHSIPPDYQDYPYNLSGPVEPDSIGLLKPDVSSPGASTISTTIGGGYGTFGGTSAATPHVAGVVALLLSANPELEPADVSRILQTTGVEKGAPGKDVRYGAGRIDAYSAYLQAKAERGAPADLTNLVAYSDYRTPNEMLLSWENPTRLLNGDTLTADMFRVFISRDGALVDSVEGEFSSYVDSNLVDGQAYAYQLYAKTNIEQNTSNIAETNWIAGGAPQPNPVQNFSVSGDQQQVMITWQSPTQNIDGTPMDDFAGIRLYQNGLLVAEFARTSADTGRADSAFFSPASAGYYLWQIAVIDDESPVNESEPSEVLGTPLSAPIADAFDISGVPDSAVWVNSNAEVNDRAIDPPSGGMSLNLNGTPLGEDIVDLRPVDTSQLQGLPEPAALTYHYQPKGSGNAPEAGDSLQVYLKNDRGEWLLARAYPGSGLQPFSADTVYLDSIPAGDGTFYHGQFQVRFRSTGGAGIFPNDDWFVDDVYLGPVVLTGVSTLDDPLPQSYALLPNYPNPFNPSTTIRYELPHFSEVTLEIYNALGQRVRTLVQTKQPAGRYQVTWNGQNSQGQPVASGIYFYRISATATGSVNAAFARVHKMVLLK